MNKRFTCQYFFEIRIFLFLNIQKPDAKIASGCKILLFLKLSDFTLFGEISIYAVHRGEKCIVKIDISLNLLLSEGQQGTARSHRAVGKGRIFRHEITVKDTVLLAC